MLEDSSRDYALEKLILVVQQTYRPIVRRLSMDLSSFGKRISLALFHVEEKMPHLRQSVYNRLSGLPIDLIAIDLPGLADTPLEPGATSFF